MARLVGMAVALTALVLSACAAAPGGDEPAVSRHFESLRTQPSEMAMFLRRMPKGGDLHSHLSGAIYAESYVRWAADDGLCLIVATASLAEPPCDAGAGKPPLAAHVATTANYAALIDALSMRNYLLGRQSGHDQFFATFGRFAAATVRRQGDMLAEVAARAAAQNILYLELMVSPRMRDAAAIGVRAGWDGNASATVTRLRNLGLAALIPLASQDLDAAEQRQRNVLGCGEGRRPGCEVVVRYVSQIIRTLPPEQAFAQAALAFELARQEPRIVGLNFVAPEDDRVALADYRLHMRMLRDLAAIYPEVPVTLHAGELWLGLVPPDQLGFHIREAVEVAGARRIGHGVAIAFEHEAGPLLREMARRGVLVEINLTSNDVILGVRGAEHPLPLYRRSGVPIALSTDDEGVSRIDLTHEYVRAAQEFSLGYGALKEMSRNSLTYSFLRGPSLWREPFAALPVSACAEDRPGDASPSAPCASYLAGSEKAALQWRLEAAFDRFERSVAAGAGG